MSAIQAALASGAIPNHILNVAPPGTKMHLLELGWLACDEGFVVRGGNTSRKTTEGESFVNKRRRLPMYAVLIDHPHEGLILWETGAGDNYPTVSGPVVSDVFARVEYKDEHRLENAIKATGNRIEDVRKVVIGHLHADHAGGLECFVGRPEVEIWVHDEELRGAFWSVATGADDGVYRPDYLQFSLNWKTFDERTVEFCQGITLHHLPGHTEGLCGMQVNLQDSGTFVFISDHCHVIENWRDSIPQGWLARNHPAWFQSTQRLKRLEASAKARVIPGHDESVFTELKEEGGCWT
ncbi:Metallo-hydrolase/oxidoreductase [Aspergillus unguis]